MRSAALPVRMTLEPDAVVELDTVTTLEAVAAALRVPSGTLKVAVRVSFSASDSGVP